MVPLDGAHRLQNRIKEGRFVDLNANANPGRFGSRARLFAASSRRDQISSRSKTVKKIAIPLAHHNHPALDSPTSEQGLSTAYPP